MALYDLGDLKIQTPPSGEYWVADTAVVVGNVVIGHDVSIWFGSVVRGDNDRITIGNGSNIQDLCMLHVDPGFPLTIGENVGIGHRAILHGCTIGAGSLIGMGAVIMNGAVIGEQCLIGANTLVPEGKVIPPRSLVLGSPGKVVRELTEADDPKITRGVGFYKRNWRLFASTMARKAD